MIICIRLLITLRLKERFRKINEHKTPLGWGCLGHVWALFFTYWKVKQSAILKGHPVVHMQKIPPNLGRIGCVCSLAFPKSLDVLFSNM